MGTPNYDVNYDDKRFTQVSSDKKEALSDLEEIYGKKNEKTGEYEGGIIGEADGYFNDRIDALDEWEAEQKRLQNEKTDFAINKIEQQKAQAKKDYTKEQSGAYVDWQKQSNQYGANAEAMAAQGMTNTGYAESSQVSMYNTYQNRVATAREAYNLAVMNYNNNIKEAQLQNSSILAEIAFETQKQQLELALQGFQYKNQLVLEMSNQKRQIESEYYARYQDVLKQINTENALAEEVRQYNATLAEQKRQFDILHPQTTGGGDGGGGYVLTKQGNDIIKTDKKTGEKTKLNDNKIEPKNKTKQPTIDMQSVLALGYGPISEKRLSELVDNGLVSMYVVGDKVKFKHSASYVKQKGLMG